MVLLNLITSNNHPIAYFKSLSYKSIINIADNSNNVYDISVGCNIFSIYNNINSNISLTYADGSLNVSNININNITNTSPLFFPNKNISLNSYSFQSSDNFPGYYNYNVFTDNPEAYWKSDSVYNLNGSFNTTYSSYLTYNFNNLNIFGSWIEVSLPFLIILKGINIELLGNNNDPGVIYLLAFNNLTNKWDYLLKSYNVIQNYIPIETNNYYSIYTLIITNTNGGIYTMIDKITLYSTPIFYINNKIIVNDNNIYNLNSISTNQLILNNVAVKSFSDISAVITSNALLTISSNLNIEWYNNNGVAYNSPNINKVALGKSTANALLDVNGSLNYNNRLIQNSININTTLTNIYNNSYIKIGTFVFNATEYIEINLKIVDYTLLNSAGYYSQSIKIYGITNVNSKFYSETISDISTSTQRITDTYYNYINASTVEFYVKYNDLLDITNTNPFVLTSLFSNVIYIDCINTSANNNIFTVPNTIQYPILTQSLKTIIKNSERYIDNINNKNIHKYYNYLYSDSLSFSNLSFINYNPNSIIYNDYNGNIKSTNVSYNQLNSLSNIALNPNTALIVNNNGVIDNSKASSYQLEGLSNISAYPNSLVYVNSKGILDASLGISKNQLLGLSLQPNRIVLTDSNGVLTSSGYIQNNNNIANLANLFNYTNNTAFTYSNIAINTNIINDNSCSLLVNGKINTVNLYASSNILLGGSIFSWNSNINRVQYNYSDIADDVFKKICKYPISNNYTFLSQLINTEYVYTLNISNTNYILKINNNDYIQNFEVYNIFNYNPLTYWRSSTNFNATGYNIGRYINNNNNYTNTLCGAYITFTLPDAIILKSYNIFYSYSNNANTINSFNLLGYNTNNDTWTIIDSQSNITNWNNNNQNIFYIKSIPKLYNTYALCITQTNTDTNYNFAIINSIEFYGINNYYGNIVYNSVSSNVPFILGNNFIGISNYKPQAYLSICPDLLNSPTESLLNLNHTCNITTTNISVRLLNLTRPSNDSNIGIRASHILTNWINANSSANTRYDIKLTHQNINTENLLISALSDGRIGLNSLTPNLNLNNNYLSILSNICIYNSANKYIGIGITNIINNYSIILPNNSPSIYNLLNVNSVDSNNNVFLNWVNPQSIFNTLPFCKIGNANTITRDTSPIVLQVAGSCIIGNDNTGLANITNSYISNNTLIVVGNIYTTLDISTDSDISYKYNLKKILNPLEKVKKLNGFTFQRNDVDDKERRYCGLIAQDVEKIMPEAIVKKHDKKLRVLYTNLSCLWVESIKELDIKVNYINMKLNVLIVVVCSYIFYNIIK